jgi:hypothetical protein
VARSYDAVDCRIPGDLETAVQDITLDDVLPVVIFPGGILAWTKNGKLAV